MAAWCNQTTLNRRGRSKPSQASRPASLQSGFGSAAAPGQRQANRIWSSRTRAASSSRLDCRPPSWAPASGFVSGGGTVACGWHHERTWAKPEMLGSGGGGCAELGPRAAAAPGLFGTAAAAAANGPRGSALGLGSGRPAIRSGRAGSLSCY